MRKKVDFTTTEMKFPQKGDQLISSEGDWQMTACLNFARDQALGYASGYRLAADMLVDQIAETHFDQDRLVYPIGFLYRQHLELSLKLIIRDARDLLEIDAKPIMRHELDVLWQAARPLMERCYPNDPATVLDDAQLLIDQFMQIDPLSMSFRYSTDRKGQPSLEGITHINLEHLRKIVGSLADLLDGIHMGITVKMDEKSEYEQIMRSYAPSASEFY